MLCLTDSIRQSDPSLQPLLNAVAEAPTLAMMILAAWQLARALAVRIVEEGLAERAQRPIQWPCCPEGGTRLQSKGFIPRQVESLLGRVQWRRRVGRCPHGCKRGQVAPLDEALGLEPYQRTSRELKLAACALAVFVPFEIATALLRLLSGVQPSPRAVWLWVQEAGQWAIDRLQRELEKLASGQLPDEEPMDKKMAAQPLLVGADGVMVPFRPEAGTPQGKTLWREVKVAILARWGRHITRTGQEVPRLERRRLVAVLGDLDALSPRLWLEAVRQGILSAQQVVWLSDGARGHPGRWPSWPEACGVCSLSAWPDTLWASWISTTLLRISGKGQRPGLMDAPSEPVSGLPRHGIGCATASPIVCWRILPRRWKGTGCPTRPVKR